MTFRKLMQNKLLGNLLFYTWGSWSPGRINDFQKVSRLVITELELEPRDPVSYQSTWALNWFPAFAIIHTLQHSQSIYILLLGNIIKYQTISIGSPLSWPWKQNFFFSFFFYACSDLQLTSRWIGLWIVKRQANKWFAPIRWSGIETRKKCNF